MKKIFVVLVLFIASVALFSQPVLGPANGPGGGYNILGRDLFMPNWMTIKPTRLEGTMEVNNGFMNLRTSDGKLYLMLGVPRFVGLTIDTPPNTGKAKIELWGYIQLSPLNQVLVTDLLVDGQLQFIPQRYGMMRF